MKYSHKGNAKATTLAAPCAPADMTVTVADGAGYPDGVNGPFWIALSKGQLIEEKILCATRSGNLFQVWTDGTNNGRGQDDTTAQDHPVNSPVEHVWTATEAEQISTHVNEGDGAHGYPPKAAIVTTTGDQTVDGKVFTNAALDAPVVSAPAITGGTVTGATKVSLAGAQSPAEFRVRDIMLSTADPAPTDGEDGDVWMKYV
jgi:hypothetical protein